MRFARNKSHKSTITKDIGRRYTRTIRENASMSSYSSRQAPIPNQRVIKQKQRRWRQRIIAQVDIARMLDLPMTQALTINWEQICGAKQLCKSMQSSFLLRLQRLAKHLRFELAYIWVNATGTKVGLHAHMMLYWPHRYFRYLMRALQKLTSDPTAIHIQSIQLDYQWGQYLADHITKHSYYSQDRNLGWSKNLVELQ